MISVLQARTASIRSRIPLAAAGKGLSWVWLALPWLLLPWLVLPWLVLPWTLLP